VSRGLGTSFQYIAVNVRVLLAIFLFFSVPFYVYFLVFYVCFPFCVFCVFLLFCVLFLLLYIAVSFLFLYKSTDRSHRMETQLQ